MAVDMIAKVLGRVAARTAPRIGNPFGDLVTPLFRYVPGDSLAAATFSRASTATYVDANGVVQTAASSVARDAHYIGGVRHLLVEGQRTNYQFHSGNIADPAWSQDSTDVTRTANAATAPDGSVTACKVQVVQANVRHAVYQNNVQFAAGASLAASFYFKLAQGTPIVQVVIGSGSAGAYANFNLQTGAVTATGVGASGGTVMVARIEALGSGWYRCSVGGSLDMASSNQTYGYFNLVASPTAAMDATDGALNDAVYAWGGQLEDNAFASSYIATTTTTVSRAVDILTFPGVVPQALTGYIKVRYCGTLPSNYHPAYLYQDDQAGAQADFMLWEAVPSGATLHVYNSAQVAQGTPGVGSLPVPGDTVELNAVWLAALSDRVEQSLNGAAITQAAAAGAVSAFPSSTTPRLCLGGKGNGGSETHFLAIAKVVILAGEQTIDTMRAA